MEHMHDEMVRAMQLCGAASLAALTPDLVKQVKELIPTGKLRVGVAARAVAVAAVRRQGQGRPPRGVTVDLGNALASELGVAAEFMVAPNTGELVDALEAGRIDVSFMPVDEERKKRIDFGPVYFLVESTYMVTEASGIKTVDEVDRPACPRRRHRQHHDDPRRRRAR